MAALYDALSMYALGVPGERQNSGNALRGPEDARLRGGLSLMTVSFL